MSQIAESEHKKCIMAEGNLMLWKLWSCLYHFDINLLSCKLCLWDEICSLCCVLKEENYLASFG